MIGAVAPPPSMMDAARPVVRMRARPPRRSEDFGTGRDNIAASGQGAKFAWGGGFGIFGELFVK